VTAPVPAIDDLYQATIVDHDRAPRNHGPLAGATHHATIENPLCGDVVTVHARVVDGAVSEIAFEGRGCALSRAAASIMTTMVRHRTLDDAPARRRVRALRTIRTRCCDRRRARRSSLVRRGAAISLATRVRAAAF
jgi:NifU-like protein involved in Fe-S cluster formation